MKPKSNSICKMTGLCLLILVAGLSQTVRGQAFVHPGLLHKAADFTRMTTEVNAGANPWIQGWEVLTNNSHAQSSYVPNPQTDIDRGGTVNNYGIFYNDIAAAYQNALVWKISGNTANASTATKIVTEWATTCTEVTGDSDRFLAYGIYGYEYCQSVEILRGYSGFSSTDLSECQKFMTNVFLPGNMNFLTNHNGACISNYWANWDLCNIASMAAIGVLCDNRTIYNFALDYFTNVNFLPVDHTGGGSTGSGNGEIDHSIPFIYTGTFNDTTAKTLGQGQEEGRDQGHGGLDVSLWGVVCQQFYNQGNDMFAWKNDKVLSAVEYYATYNINTNNTVPYTTYFWGNGDTCVPSWQTVISTSSRNVDIRPSWELMYSHYVGDNGLAAPNTASYAAWMRPEGGGAEYGPNSGGYDQLGFGTLCYTVTAGNPVAQGNYILQSAADGNNVDDYGYTTNGAPLNQYAAQSFGSTGNQNWNLIQLSGSTYMIQGAKGLYVDSLGKTTSGSTVGLWAFSSTNNIHQQWTITWEGGGHYKLTNVGNGLCLDTAGLTANGSALEMVTSSSNITQLWKILGSNPAVRNMALIIP